MGRISDKTVAIDGPEEFRVHPKDGFTAGGIDGGLFGA